MASGDVGYLTEDGLLFVTGRADDMIVSGGENVFPREVEDLLLGQPGVADVAVVGVDDAEFGQRLAAYVVKERGARLSAAAVKQSSPRRSPVTRHPVTSSSSTNCHGRRPARSAATNLDSAARPGRTRASRRGACHRRISSWMSGVLPVHAEQHRTPRPRSDHLTRHEHRRGLEPRTGLAHAQRDRSVRFAGQCPQRRAGPRELRGRRRRDRPHRLGRRGACRRHAARGRCHCRRHRPSCASWRADRRRDRRRGHHRAAR